MNTAMKAHLDRDLPVRLVTDELLRPLLHNGDALERLHHLDLLQIGRQETA